jgi:hypothetical protein
MRKQVSPPLVLFAACRRIVDVNFDARREQLLVPLQDIINQSSEESIDQTREYEQPPGKIALSFHVSLL